jgi:outer membrane immunogenic protein
MRFNVLTGAVALLAGSCAVPALAADLPGRVAPAPVFTSPALPSWAGPYVGIHAGALFADRDRTVGFNAFDCTPCSTGATASATFDGPGDSGTAALGGVQAGWNWQSGALVYGVEADFSLSGESSRRAYSLSAATLQAAGVGAITGTTPDGFNAEFKSSIDWLATARARVGFTAGSILFYATGGAAFADLSSEASYLSLVGTTLVPAVIADDSVEVGWTVGAGIEALLTPNLSAKLEYNYVDFGENRRLVGSYIDNPVRLRQFVTVEEEVSLHVVKLGLNLRFP